MAVRRKKNLFGFGSKKTSGCARKSSLTFAQAKSAAFQAGQKSGDTGAWESWKCGKGLQDRGAPVLRQLENEYRRGVEVGETRERKMAEAKEKKMAAKKEKRKVVGRVRGRSIYRQGDYFWIQGDPDSHFDSLRDAKSAVNPASDKTPLRYRVDDYDVPRLTPALKLAKARSQQADWDYQSTVRDNISGKLIAVFERGAKAKPNPAKFDRCIRDVKKAAKKTGKPVNAYAVCTAAGTRATGNPVRTIYATFRTKEDSGDGRPGWELQPEGAKWPIAEAVHLSKDATPERIQREAQAFFSEDIKIVKRSSSAGNPVSRNALWKVTQGKIKGEVKREGKRFLGLVTSQHGTQHHVFDSLKGAQAWVRDEVFTMASNPANIGTLASGILQGIGTHVGTHALGKLKHTRGKVSKRRNPEAAAAIAYEQFTGFEPSRVTEIESTEHVHKWLAGNGQLIALCLIDVKGKPFTVLSNGWSYDGPQTDISAKKPSKTANGWQFDPSTNLDAITWLNRSEDGKQLYILGGDQTLDLPGMGFSKTDVRDKMLIGTITRVWYRMRKTFEAKGKEEVDFYHDFGKEGSEGICPVLEYKPRDPSLHFVGGRYTIAKPDSSLGGVSPGIVG